MLDFLCKMDDIIKTRAIVIERIFGSNYAVRILFGPAPAVDYRIFHFGRFGCVKGNFFHATQIFDGIFFGSVICVPYRCLFTGSIA